MKRIISLTVILTFALLALTLTASAQGPGLMNYQGYLTNPGGDPLSGDYEMTFTIYDAATNGDVVWSEPHTYLITVTEGVFDTVLGYYNAITDDVFDDDERWLEITVNGEVIEDRTRLVNAPYAFRVNTVNGATGGTIYGNVAIYGDVGIGAPPVALLNLMVAGTLAPDWEGTGVRESKQASPSYRFGNGTENTGFSSPWTNEIAVITSGTERMRIDQNGNVGIGTPTPEAKLDVNGAIKLPWPGADSYQTLLFNDNNETGPPGEDAFRIGYDDGFFGPNKDALVIEKTDANNENPDGGIAFVNTGDDGVQEVTMVISGAGNVGIGHDAPEERLDVKGNVRIRNNVESLTIDFIGDEGDGSPAINLFTDTGNRTFKVDGDEGDGGSVVRLWNSAGTQTIKLDGDYYGAGLVYVRGNIVLVSPSTGDPVLEMGEGLDYAEGFNVSDVEHVCPGAVVVIDPDNPGKLTMSRRSYDRRVAGIVAGAKGMGSGVRLGTHQFDLDVALAGRVYCNVDATEEGVEPGDLLTTSSTPGYAMKVSDYTRAQGAILGKAMERLQKGQKGQILVLVTLQ